MVAFPDLSREDENGAYTTSGVPKIVAPYLATTDEDLEKIKNMYDDAPPTPINDSISSTRSSITFISVTSIPDPTDIISTTSIQPRKEHWWNVMIEVALPFFLGGVGTIAAGIILGSVEIQASVAAIIVAIFAMTVHYLIAGEEDARNALLLMASGIATATSSCFVLDFILIAVIIISHRYKMNPDNVATPMAASIGDVVCISLFSQIASQFYLDHADLTAKYILPNLPSPHQFGNCGKSQSRLKKIQRFYLHRIRQDVVAEVHGTHHQIAMRPYDVAGVERQWFFPPDGQMGGIVLDLVVNRFNGFVVFQPIINGIGGNLVSVQASRISTYLHVTKPKQMGFIPPQTRLFASPWRVLVKGYAPTCSLVTLAHTLDTPVHTLALGTPGLISREPRTEYTAITERVYIGVVPAKGLESSTSRIKKARIKRIETPPDVSPSSSRTLPAPIIPHSLVTLLTDLLFFTLGVEMSNFITVPTFKLGRLIRIEAALTPAPTSPSSKRAFCTTHRVALAATLADSTSKALAKASHKVRRPECLLNLTV
uniref:SLC41A/MgtE integral membrane domain-containing protein n=1 Tax=Timema monikensis TaxID=170555 RepID=A0A7R9HMY5_9NEOP|nr:unnamed protein product [Timema monikensis]